MIRNMIRNTIQKDMKNEAHKNSRNPGDFSLRQRPKRLSEIEENVLRAIPLRADRIHAAVSQNHFFSTPNPPSSPPLLLVQPMKQHAHVRVLHLRERQQLRRRRVLERLAPPASAAAPRWAVCLRLSALLGPHSRSDCCNERRAAR